MGYTDIFKSDGDSITTNGSNTNGTIEKNSTGTESLGIHESKLAAISHLRNLGGSSASQLVGILENLQVGKITDNQDVNTLRSALQNITTIDSPESISLVMYIGNLDNIAKKYERALDEVNLNARINILKNIDIDFNMGFESWDDFIDSYFTQVGGKLSSEERSQVIFLLEQQIKPNLEILIKQNKEFKAANISGGIDLLLTQITNTNSNPDGSITLDLNHSSLTQKAGNLIQGVMASGIDLVSEGVLEQPMVYGDGKISFASKTEAVRILGELKIGLKDMEGFFSKSFDSIKGIVNSTVETVVIKGIGSIVGLAWKVEKGYGNLLKNDIEFSTSNGLGVLLLMVGIHFGGILMLNKALESAVSGTDRNVTEKITKSLNKLEELYTEAGLDKDAGQIGDMSDRINNLHPETKEGVLDNYAKLGQVYRELQTWRGTPAGDGMRSFTSYIGDLLDNGTLFDLKNFKFWGNKGLNSLGLAKDTALLPWKLGFIFINKGPNGGLNGWQVFRTKGKIIQDFLREIETNTNKLKSIFGVVDKIGSIDNLKLSSSEIEKLKASILESYRVSKNGKIDPINKTRLSGGIRRNSLPGKNPFKIYDFEIPRKIDIDRIAALEIEKLLASKLGVSKAYPREIIRLLKKLNTKSSEFQKNIAEVTKIKGSYLDFIKFYPDISDAKEAEIIKRADILEAISYSKDVFEEEILKTMKDDFGILLTKTQISDFKKQVNDFKGIETKDTRGDKSKLKNVLNKKLSAGEITAAQYKTRAAAIDTFFASNKTLWVPHYVEILDRLFEGKPITGITHAIIDIKRNDVASLISDKETAIKKKPGSAPLHRDPVIRGPVVDIEAPKPLHEEAEDIVRRIVLYAKLIGKPIDAITEAKTLDTINQKIDDGEITKLSDIELHVAAFEVKSMDEIAAYVKTQKRIKGEFAKNLDAAAKAGPDSFFRYVKKNLSISRAGKLL